MEIRHGSKELDSSSSTERSSPVLLSAAKHLSARSTFRTIQLRMGSGTQMNKRRQQPNSAQWLRRGSTNWPFSPSVGAYGRKNVGTPLQLREDGSPRNKLTLQRACFVVRGGERCYAF